jgi:hypothetical protein
VTPSGGLRRLATAADLWLDRERLSLKRADEAIRALRAEAEALRHLRADGGARLALRGPAAPLAQSWDAARERRLLALGEQIAELAAQRNEAQARVARACGRVIAIRKLAARRRD